MVLVALSNIRIGICPTQGRFVVDPERSELSEHAVHHFQQLYTDAMDAGL